MRRIALLGCALAAGCGGAEAARLAQAKTDTLPGGMIQVSNAGPTAWSDSTGASLVEEGRFSGEDGTAGELGDPRSLAVDGEDRVYVVDSKPATIKVFTPDGKLVRTIGREGEGPGEFRAGFIAVRGDRLVLHDPRIGRTSVFDTAGTFLKSWLTSCCYWTDIQIDEANRIYIPSIVVMKGVGEHPRGTPYVRWSFEGVILDTVWVPPHEVEKYWTVSLNDPKTGKNIGMMSTSIPFMPTLSAGLHPGGGFVYGWSGSYSLVRSTTGKDSLRVFGRAWTPDPVTDERRKGEVESRVKQAAESYGETNVRNSFHLSDVPVTLPAFVALRVDQSGRVWVRRWPVADTTRSYFDVFDSTGAYLGPVTLALRLSDYGNQAWMKDGVVAIVEGDDGRPTVVRLKLGIKKQ